LQLEVFVRARISAVSESLPKVRFSGKIEKTAECAVFTGIIEEVGVIQELRFLSEGAAITVVAREITAGLKIGDSVSVNGVCLTATRVGADCFLCDISAETLRHSSFRQAKQGTHVNLERSLMIGERLGGHFVLGHVDEVGRLIAKTASGQGFEMSFEFPRELERYLVYKGSIAVNGISLTISSLDSKSFSVSVIPHTYRSTTLNQLMIGDPANIEVDVIGRYFERFFQLGWDQNIKTGSRLTAEYLKSQGF
jgi:riboflavin synthase